MSTLFKDNFNSYDDGDLNTQGDWSGDASFDIQTATVGNPEGEGVGKEVKVDVDSGSGITIEKTGSQVADGGFVIYLRNNNGVSPTGFHLKEGTTIRISVQLGEGGELEWNLAGGWTKIQDYSANTWYKIGLEWRSSDKKIRVKIDSGNWSGWVASQSNFTSYIDKVVLVYYAGAGYEGFWDYIKDTDIEVSDTISLSESLAGTSMGFKKTDAVSLSESMTGDISFTVKDTITLNDRLLQLWRKLAKHISSYVYLSRGLSQGTKDARIAHWEMDDNLDTDVVLDSEGDHNGAMKNDENNYTSEQHVVGKVGTGAFDFDGTNDYVEIPDHDDFSFGDGSSDSPFSISAWIYMDSATNFKIISKYATDNYEWAFGTDGAGDINLFLTSLDLSKWIGRSYDTALSTGQWYHVVGTYDGTSAVTGIKVYVDGVRKDDKNLLGGTYVAMDNGTTPVYIGRQSGGYSNGKIDEVMIFNKELTQTDVTALYKLGASTYTRETKSTSVWSYLTKRR